MGSEYKTDHKNGVRAQFSLRRNNRGQTTVFIRG